MDEKKEVYLKIQNPIEDQKKWNLLLNLYSIAYDENDFWNKIFFTKEKKLSTKVDVQEKRQVLLTIWSFWKEKVCALSREEKEQWKKDNILGQEIDSILEYCQSHPEEEKAIEEIPIKKYPAIFSYLSKMFYKKDNLLVISPCFPFRDKPSCNIVVSLVVNRSVLYPFLNRFILSCKDKFSYYVTLDENKEDVPVEIHTLFQNIQKVDNTLQELEKENVLVLQESNLLLLEGTYREKVGMKEENPYYPPQYEKTRTSLLFHALESVIYEYVLSHLKMMISYQDKKLTLEEYLAEYMMEKTISQILIQEVENTKEYITILNSENYQNLKDYLKREIEVHLLDILKRRIYLPGKEESLLLKVKGNQQLEIEPKMLLYAIRTLTPILLAKDTTLAFLLKTRIQNECQFAGIDPDKFCLSIVWKQKALFDEYQYEKYQKSLEEIHKNTARIEELLKENKLEENKF